MYAGMKGLESKEESEALTDFLQSFNRLRLTECKNRCPDNQGYEDKCEHCDVQYLCTLVSSHFKMKAQYKNLYYAMRWLLCAEHNQFKDNN